MDQTEKLYEQLKKAEQEKQDVLSILHSYRHICGEHTPDELSRLVQADEDGRCLVAPFKIGQTVKHKTENWIGQVNEIAWNDEGLMLFVSSGGYTGYYPPGAFEKAVDSSEADSTALLKMYKAPQLPEGNLLPDSNEEIDYQKLLQDLQDGCKESCAACDYSEGIEFNCSLSRVCPKAIETLLAKIEEAERHGLVNFPPG